MSPEKIRDKGGGYPYKWSVPINPYLHPTTFILVLHHYSCR